MLKTFNANISWTENQNDEVDKLEAANNQLRLYGRYLERVFGHQLTTAATNQREPLGRKSPRFTLFIGSPGRIITPTILVSIKLFPTESTRYVGYVRNERIRRVTARGRHINLFTVI